MLPLRTMLLVGFIASSIISDAFSQSTIVGYLNGESSKFARALDHVRRRELKEARVVLKDALRADPSDPYLHEILGDVCVSLKDIDRAIESYTKALQRDPRRFSAYEKRGYQRLRRKEWDHALADYSSAIQIDPNSSNCHYRRGVAYYGQGLYAKARADLERAYGLGMVSPTAFALGKLLAVCPDASVRDGIRAIDYAQEACKQRKYVDYRSLSFLAAAHAEAGQWDEAIRWSRQALKQAEGENRFREWLNLELYQSHEPLREFTKELIAKKPPTTAGEALEYALVKEHLGDRLGAIADLRKAMEMNPRLAVAHCQFGRLIELDDLSEAIDHFNRCLELNPKNVEAFARRGLAYFKLGKYRRALEDSKTALKLDADLLDPIPVKLLALASCGEPERALQELSDVSQELLGNPARRFIRGHCYLIRGRLCEAINEFTEILRGYPDDLLTLADRAVALSAVGKENEARRDLEECCRLSPSMRTPTEARMRAAKEKRERS
jgi:tetratricopeptide (TPR) repeat protein